MCVKLCQIIQRLNPINDDNIPLATDVLQLLIPGAPWQRGRKAILYRSNFIVNSHKEVANNLFP